MFPEEDLESAGVEGFTSRALIYERGNLSPICLGLLPEMRPEAHWSGVDILLSRSTTDHIGCIQEIFVRCVHLVYKSSTLQSSTYVHSMFKAPPTAKLEIKIESCCYLISSLIRVRHWCCAHTWSTYTYVCQYSMCIFVPLHHFLFSLQRCPLRHLSSDWNLQTFHCSQVLYTCIYSAAHFYNYILSCFLTHLRLLFLYPLNLPSPPLHCRSSPLPSSCETLTVGTVPHHVAG